MSIFVRDDRLEDDACIRITCILLVLKVRLYRWRGQVERGVYAGVAMGVLQTLHSHDHLFFGNELFTVTDVLKDDTAVPDTQY